jgi:hypothetical protein
MDDDKALTLVIEDLQDEYRRRWNAIVFCRSAKSLTVMLKVMPEVAKGVFAQSLIASIFCIGIRSLKSVSVSV